VDPRGPGHLGDPGEGFLHIPLGHHHEIRQFVDHDHHVRQLRKPEAFFFDPLVVGVDPLDALLGDEPIAPFHLLYGPAQDLGGLFGFTTTG
jgi:hypothetical protein